MTKVFVYGTLKRGYPLFREGFVSEVEEDTVSNYSIFTHPKIPFPFLKEDDGGVAYGEVHTLADPSYIHSLDMIEGEGRLYRRKRITTDSGETVYAYVFMHNVTDMEKNEGAWICQY